MKKLISTILSLVLTLSLSVVALAAEIKNVTVIVPIPPTYTVNIPASTNVDFNAVSTNFGSIRLVEAQINQNKCVKVTFNASGTLKNQADKRKTIAYTITDPNGTPFTTAEYTTAGNETDLAINITKDVWNRAPSGYYSDVLTFDISYEDPTPLAQIKNGGERN